MQPDAAGADAVLNAEIVVDRALAGWLDDDSQLASRYQFVLTMKLDFVDSRSNKSLWVE